MHHERMMIELARDNRGAETGNGPRRAQEQLKLLARAKVQPAQPVVKTAKR